MGISGQGEQSLSPKTQKNENDNAIREIINKRSDVQCAWHRRLRISLHIIHSTHPHDVLCAQNVSIR